MVLHMQVYERFGDLSIWDRIGRRLDWYKGVSLNRFPAKYLIARYTDAGNSRAFADTDVEKHMEIYRKSARSFKRLKKSVLQGQKLSELPVPEYSLLDLARDITSNMLRSCIFCRWRCKVDRVEGKRLGACMLADESRVSSFFHHTGEELVFRGTHGSGTIFFTSCNMRCLFCQNSDISRDRFNGVPVSGKDIADMAMQLRNEGCHNINYVGGEPSIHLHSIVDSIWHMGNEGSKAESPFISSGIMVVKQDHFPYPYRKEFSEHDGFFNVPILFNTNMFLSLEAMEILRPLVDIWLPDFKFGPGGCAVRLSRTPWYYETVTSNLKKLNQWNEDVMIRHLIMPNHVECCTKPVLKWISDNMNDVPVNIMAQYRPEAFADPTSRDFNRRAQDIARKPYQSELDESWNYAEELGINYREASFE